MVSPVVWKPLPMVVEPSESIPRRKVPRLVNCAVAETVSRSIWPICVAKFVELAFVAKNEVLVALPATCRFPPI